MQEANIVERVTSGLGNEPWLRSRIFQKKHLATGTTTDPQHAG
jgi:hypothetical protein